MTAVEEKDQIYTNLKNNLNIKTNNTNELCTYNSIMIKLEDGKITCGESIIRFDGQELYRLSNGTLIKISEKINNHIEQTDIKIDKIQNCWLEILVADNDKLTYHLKQQIINKCGQLVP